MEHFTKEQIEQMIDDFWSSFASQCPDCNSRLEFTVSKSLVLPLWHSVRCPKCGKTGQLQDKKHYQIREWTEDEKKAIEKSFYENNIAKCPVDGTTLMVWKGYFPEAPKGKSVLHTLCRRCGNSLDGISFKETGK